MHVIIEVEGANYISIKGCDNAKHKRTLTDSIPTGYKNAIIRQ